MLSQQLSSWLQRDPGRHCWLAALCLVALKCSTSYPGGNQVDGVSPALHRQVHGPWWSSNPVLYQLGSVTLYSAQNPKCDKLFIYLPDMAAGPLNPRGRSRVFLIRLLSVGRLLEGHKKISQKLASSRVPSGERRQLSCRLREQSE